MTTDSQVPTVLLIPLDERPVNTALPQTVGAIGGAQVVLPPAELLPRMRNRADPEAVGRWLTERATDSGVIAAVVSIDGLVHGGLIASRTSNDSLGELLRRLGVFAEIRQRAPRVERTAFATVTRASNSTIADEDPDYWPAYGPALHEWGAAAHRRFERVTEPGDAHVADHVPAQVRGDFQSRRLRNHIVDLELLRMRAAGLVNKLLITADDTAPFAAGTVEQRWINHWRELLELQDVAVYPGADEVACVLIARLLVGNDPPVRVQLRWADDAGMQRVPPFENRRYIEALTSQVQAAGAQIVQERPEAIVVVHAPGAERVDWCNPRATEADPSAADRCAELVVAALNTSLPVGVVDVRQTNGGDPHLVARLDSRDALSRLSAYGGWNTAGNATGSTIATLIADVIGQRHRVQNQALIKEQVLARVLEDTCYQSSIRRELDGLHGVHLTRENTDPVGLPAFEDTATSELVARLRNLHGFEDYQVESATLPWNRSFEIALKLTRDCD